MRTEALVGMPFTLKAKGLLVRAIDDGKTNNSLTRKVEVLTAGDVNEKVKFEQPKFVPVSVVEPLPPVLKLGSPRSAARAVLTPVELRMPIEQPIFSLTRITVLWLSNPIHVKNEADDCRPCTVTGRPLLEMVRVDDVVTPFANNTTWALTRKAKSATEGDVT